MSIDLLGPPDDEKQNDHSVEMGEAKGNYSRRVSIFDERKSSVDEAPDVPIEDYERLISAMGHNVHEDHFDFTLRQSYGYQDVEVCVPLLFQRAYQIPCHISCLRDRLSV